MTGICRRRSGYSGRMRALWIGVAISLAGPVRAQPPGFPPEQGPPPPPPGPLPPPTTVPQDPDPAADKHAFEIELQGQYGVNRDRAGAVGFNLQPMGF